jgi:hypothetical protein
MIFTSENLAGSGHYIVRTDQDYIKDTGYLSTIMSKIGYHHNARSRHGAKYQFVSMADGWSHDGWFDRKKSNNSSDWIFKPFKNIEDIANYLNNNPNKDKYRFATVEEVIRVVLHQRIYPRCTP